MERAINEQKKLERSYVLLRLNDRTFIPQALNENARAAVRGLGAMLDRMFDQNIGEAFSQAEPLMSRATPLYEKQDRSWQNRERRRFKSTMTMYLKKYSWTG
jgi:hypothetical protein